MTIFMTIAFSPDSSIREQDRDIVCVFALLKIHRYGELIGAKDVEIREEMDKYFVPLRVFLKVI